jgi:hypothetical protein
MQNNIEESYCSFIVSKLLKKKGFDVICQKGFSVDGSEIDMINKNSENIVISRPTHNIAIQWILQNLGFWISCDQESKEFLPKISIYKKKLWSDMNFRYNLNSFRRSQLQHIFNTPDDAINYALIYSLFLF